MSLEKSISFFDVLFSSFLLKFLTVNAVPYERLPIDAEDLSSRKTYARPVLIRQYRSLRFANKEGNICRLTPNSAFVPVRDSAVASISTSKVQDFNSYATLTEAQKKNGHSR